MVTGDAGHIKMTRVFRTSIITQLNTIKKSFLADLTPNGKLTKSFIKKIEHVRFIRWHAYLSISIHLKMISIQIFYHLPVTHTENPYHPYLCDVWIRPKLA